MLDVRPCDERDEAALTEVWHEAWHVAHAHLVPQELLSLRTLDYFKRSIPAIAPFSRVIGPLGAPLGFYTLFVNYIDRLFVGTRGHGYGTILLHDAEIEIRKNGFASGELDCLIGNSPAKTFYEAQGWILCGEKKLDLSIADKGLTLTDWIYRKDL